LIEPDPQAHVTLTVMIAPEQSCGKP